ncbi:unnamed protein product [Amoebophrya sp. A120]|nr:unnamed protein product [Amoebophrya sp. A120]|eukprot:GSA120T00012388001.1
MAAGKKKSKSGGASGAATAQQAGTKASKQTAFAGVLFRRNLLNLKIERLLQQIEIPKTEISKIEPTLHEVYKLLQECPEREFGLEKFGEQFDENLFHLYNDYSEDKTPARTFASSGREREEANATSNKNKTFHFTAPKRIEVVGSFLLKTMVKKQVDLAVFLPENLFQSKDHVNYRYADKRTAYLAVLYQFLCEKLQPSEGADSTKNPERTKHLNVEYIDGNLYRPVIVLTTNNWKLRILGTVENEVKFPDMKLQLWKNGLRPKFDVPSVTAHHRNVEQYLPATPFYNSLLLEDLYATRVLHLQHQAIEQTPELKYAILLLKRWLIVRDLSEELHCPIGILACHVVLGGGNNTTSGGAGAVVGNVLGATATGSKKNSSLLKLRDPMQIFKACLNFIVKQQEKYEEIRNSIVEKILTAEETEAKGSTRTAGTAGKTETEAENKTMLEADRVKKAQEREDRKARFSELLNELPEDSVFQQIPKHHFDGSGGCLQQLKNNGGLSSKNANAGSAAVTAVASLEELLQADHTKKSSGAMSGAKSTNSAAGAGSSSGKKGQPKETSVEQGMRLTKVRFLNLFVGELNIFQKFPLPLLEELAFEAKLTLKTLDSSDVVIGGGPASTARATKPNDFAFEQTFSVLQRPEFHWDQKIVLDLPETGSTCLNRSARLHDDHGVGQRKGRTAAQEISSEPSDIDQKLSASSSSEAPESVQAVEKAVTLLRKGLGQSRLWRVFVRFCNGTSPQPENREINDEKISANNKKRRTNNRLQAIIGLKLQFPREAEKKILRGPSADDSANVKKWQQLWPAKNLEVRRFRDGKIQQCAVFSDKERPLSIQIVDALLEKHFPTNVLVDDERTTSKNITQVDGKDENTNVSTSKNTKSKKRGKQVDVVLDSTTSASTSPSTSTAPAVVPCRRPLARRCDLGPEPVSAHKHALGLACWKDFEELKDMLLNNTEMELPLQISRVLPSSKGFSYNYAEVVDPSALVEAAITAVLGKDQTSLAQATRPDTITFQNSEKFLEHVIIEFEWSALWPRDSEQAIQVFQGAFLLEIKKQLEETKQVRAEVGTEFVLDGATTRRADDVFKTLPNANALRTAPSQQQASTSSTSIPRAFLDVIFPNRIFRIRIFYPYAPSVTENARFLTFGAQVKSKDIMDVLRVHEKKDQNSTDAGSLKAATETDGTGGAEDAGGSEAKDDQSLPGDMKEAEEQGLCSAEEIHANNLLADAHDRLHELREKWWRPKIRQAFHTLALQQPNFCKTLQLVKRWLAAKLLLTADGGSTTSSSQQRYEDFFEHLTAFVFSQASSKTCFAGLPTSANAGFARFLWTVVHVLTGESLLVLEDFGFAPPEVEGAETGLAQVGLSANTTNHFNPSTEQTQLTEEQLQLLQNSYERRRGNNNTSGGSSSSSSCNLVYCLVTRYDPHGVFLQVPGQSYLAKLKEHAVEGLQLLKEHSFNTTGEIFPAATTWSPPGASSSSSPVGLSSPEQNTTPHNPAAKRRKTTSSIDDAAKVLSVLDEENNKLPGSTATFQLCRQLLASPRPEKFDLQIQIFPFKRKQAQALNRTHPFFTDCCAELLKEVGSSFVEKMKQKYGSWATFYFANNSRTSSAAVRVVEESKASAASMTIAVEWRMEAFEQSGLTTSQTDEEQHYDVDQKMNSRSAKNMNSASTKLNKANTLKRLMSRGCSYGAGSAAALPDTDQLLNDVKMWLHGIPHRVVFA